jgi:hypothetical protein
VIGVGDRAQLGGDVLAGFGGGIDDGDQLRAFDLRQQAGVDFAQMADPDHGDAELAHAALLRSRPRPLRPSCWLWRKLSR